MGLTFPHQFANNLSMAGKVSDNNLKVLVKAAKKSDVLTDVSKKAFDDFQNAKVGICQQLTKFAATSGAFLGTATASVTAVACATYWMLRAPINNTLERCENIASEPEKILECAKTFVNPFLNNTSFISEETPIIGSYSSLLTPLKISALIATLTALDMSIGKKVGIRPMKSCMNLTKTMVKSWFVYTSYKAGEVTTKYFERKEAQKDEIRKRAHSKICEQELSTFNALADRLIERLKDVDNSPNTLIYLKNDVEKLNEQLPWIRKALASYSLDRSEVQAIMDKLLAAIQAVKSAKLELRIPISDKDVVHNIEFLEKSSPKDIKSKGLAIPTAIREELCRAEEATLGVTHALKSTGSAVINGSLAGLVVGTLIPVLSSIGAYLAKANGSPEVWEQGMVCFNSIDSLNLPPSSCSPVVDAFKATIAAATVAALVKGYSVLSRASQERMSAAIEKQGHYEKALEDLNTIYSQMLVYNRKPALTSEQLEEMTKQVTREFGNDAWAFNEFSKQVNSLKTLKQVR